MNLQKRIFRLNMLFLILSLVTMLGVTLFVMDELSTERREGIVSSQRLFLAEEILEEFQGQDFQSLAQELASNHVQLHVTKDGRSVYSNVEDPEDLTGIRLSESVAFTRMEDEVVIGRSMRAQGEIYQLYALVDEVEADDREWEDLLLRMVLIGGGTILFLLGLNLFFTRRLLVAILAPLRKLSDAVERITAGGYDQAIDYQGDKEFTHLIEGVNQMQARLLANQKEKAVYEERRTQMVAAISHDLRTPLTSIKGYSKGILDGVAHDVDRQRHYVEVIYQKSQLMEQLLETLFTFSQLERAQLPLKLEQIDLGVVLSDYVTEKQLELTDQAIEFEVEVNGPLPVKLDHLHFRRILDNLLDNSRKYADVTPLRIRLTAGVKGDHIYWSFGNNGQEVAEDTLPYLFDEFYRVDEARQLDGHGLGLAIVKQVMEGHGGQVWAENQAGLVFHFSLPLDKERI